MDSLHAKQRKVVNKKMKYLRLFALKRIYLPVVDGLFNSEWTLF